MEKLYKVYVALAVLCALLFIAMPFVLYPYYLEVHHVDGLVTLVIDKHYAAMQCRDELADLEVRAIDCDMNFSMLSESYEIRGQTIIELRETLEDTISLAFAMCIEMVTLDSHAYGYDRHQGLEICVEYLGEQIYQQDNICNVVERWAYERAGSAISRGCIELQELRDAEDE